MNPITLTLPTTNGALQIEVSLEKPLFILGANGVGKSSLMYQFSIQHGTNTKRINAHRRSWFSSNGINITATQKKNDEGYISQSDMYPESRWKDNYSEQRTSISIFDLVGSENERARSIAAAVEEQRHADATRIAENEGAFKTLNELLAISNLNIKLSLREGDLIYASKNGGSDYSIAELSDGEKNALLICSDILTARPGTVILVDEPERHLHRSIISPLLSSLFQRRKDLFFVVSTHDINLPIDQFCSAVLLLRGCVWNGNTIEKWDANLIKDTSSIPEEIKLDIFGTKQKVLFVEGTKTSLDNQIYPLIYPELSVVPVASCKDVEQAVVGIRNTEDLHWVHAFGLIDSDDRTTDQINKLAAKFIATTGSYSVESLYYNPFVIKKVTEKLCLSTGENPLALIDSANAKIIKHFTTQKPRLCARLVEKQVKDQIMLSAPNHQKIATRTPIDLHFDISAILSAEEARFDTMLQGVDITGLIARYPIRETQVINGILAGLRMDKVRYQNLVRKLIVDDPAVKTFFRDLLTPLTDLIAVAN